MNDLLCRNAHPCRVQYVRLCLFCLQFLFTFRALLMFMHGKSKKVMFNALHTSVSTLSTQQTALGCCLSPSRRVLSRSICARWEKVRRLKEPQERKKVGLAQFRFVGSAHGWCVHTVHKDRFVRRGKSQGPSSIVLVFCVLCCHHH